MPAAFNFDVIARRGKARAGLLTTPHGVVPTPAFMPVATQAAVKHLTAEECAAAGTSIIVANTFHLHLRPGEDLIAARGGLHKFMGWEGALLTDSGGFQVYSLSTLREIDAEGVSFRSPVDGAPLRLTPESATHIQERLGADFAMAFDYCISLPATREEASRAMELTTAWARRCRDAHMSPSQRLLGIVQGATYEDLRAQSARELRDLDFFGYAIGGLAVGEDPAQTAALTRFTAPLLPAEKPRYLMGVGRPEDLAMAVAAGIDLFDCVIPTREGRHGGALTDAGRISVKQAPWRDDDGPIMPGCECYTCRRFSRAYLRHLFMAAEPLGARLLSLHNVNYIQSLIKKLREEIIVNAD